MGTDRQNTFLERHKAELVLKEFIMQKSKACKHGHKRRTTFVLCPIPVYCTQSDERFFKLPVFKMNPELVFGHKTPEIIKHQSPHCGVPRIRIVMKNIDQSDYKKWIYKWSYSLQSNG